MDIKTTRYDEYTDVRHAELGSLIGWVLHLSDTEYVALGKTFDTVDDAVEHIHDSFVGRVRSGALVMDQVKPDWYKMVDVRKLDIGHTGMCIIGQVFGGDSSRMGGKPRGYQEAIRDYQDALDTLPIAAIDGGFDTEYSAYGVLKELWVFEIEKRRSE